MSLLCLLSDSGPSQMPSNLGGPPLQAQPQKQLAALPSLPSEFGSNHCRDILCSLVLTALVFSGL